MMESYFDIGRIVNTQGIRGDVRVVPLTFDPARFEKLDVVDIFYESSPGAARPPIKLTIERVWYHKQFVVLKFKEISDMSAAEKIKNGIIKIPPEKALPLERDEYYIRDLYGMKVLNEDGSCLGVIEDVLQTGANDVYLVKAPDNEQILIPAIKQCILKVDLKGNAMTVSLLDGLREKGRKS
ncbi:MAG: ribosome maturation factor RimM [Clostridiales bacterium]|jgi:16S rRNA processing protein RimM|nr:ribosome maturation factor RimM [Clostridiales bacterium]